MTAVVVDAVDAPGTRQVRDAGHIFAAFSYVDFRWLWSSGLLTSIAIWMQDVIVAWVIHQEFGNPVYLGLRSLAVNLPFLTFMAWGGVIADCRDRRRLLIASQVAQAGLMLSLSVMRSLGVLGLAQILTISVLMGLTLAQSSPTVQALLTDLVPPRQVANAVALSSLQFNLSRIVGPMIAAAALATFGVAAALAASAGILLLGAFGLWRMRAPARVSSDSGPLVASFVSGFRYLISTPPLLALAALAGTGSFLGFTLLSFLPVLADRQLGTGAWGYSALLSSFGAGAVAGALLAARLGSTPGAGRRVLVCWALTGVTNLAAVHTTSQALATALLFLSGAALTLAASTLNAVMQQSTPAAKRGRVLSLYGISLCGGTPLGSVLAGPLIRSFGITTVMGGYAVLLTATAIVLLVAPNRVRAM
jgi:MFS family permease